MSFHLAEGPESFRNPLDVVEEIVSGHEWPFDRTSREDLVAEFSGSWCDYRLHFGWMPEVCAVQFSCAFDVKVPRPRRAAVLELLAMINERMWLGHIDLTPEEGVLVFRHTMLLRGVRGATVEQLEDMVDIALVECERIYPAFQFVVWGGKPPADALAAAVLETVGEA